MAAGQAVDGHQIVDVDLEVPGNAGERVAAAHLVVTIALLGGVTLVRVDVGERGQHLFARLGRGNAQLETAWHVFRAAPYRRLQRGIQLAQ
jgi:hypothetical protein